MTLTKMKRIKNWMNNRKFETLKLKAFERKIRFSKRIINLTLNVNVRK